MKYFILLFLFSTGLAQEFFNGIKFDSDSTVDRIHHIWFSQHLTALQETPIITLAQGYRAAYRFTLLRSTRHPVAFRIDVRNDGVAYYTVKVADGKGGHAPGKIFRADHWELNLSESEEIVQLFAKAKFYDLSVSETVFGSDGTRWVLEANESGRYHVISRFMPGSGPVMDIGNYFVALAVGDFDLTP